MRSGWMVPVLTLAVCGVAIVDCTSEIDPIVRTVTGAEASERIDQVILFVEEPEISIDVHTTTLNGFQFILLDGMPAIGDTEPVPGLLEAQDELNNGDETGFCSTISLVLRNSLVNRVMNIEARDAVPLGSSSDLDPEMLFLSGSAELRIMGGVRTVYPEFRSVTEDHVSELWKEVTRELLDIVYGLGETCVDAARED